jgi:cyclohexa-1,5-dienecarbonyl-CoA hydratase
MTVTARHEGGIGHLIIDDPPLNILTQTVMRELRENLDDLALEKGLRVLLFKAEGKHFSAGASVREHLPDRVGAMIPDFMATVQAIHDFPLPVIAAVQGRCLGGAFELVMGADLIVAAEGALLGVPEIQLGVFPPAACLQLTTCGSPSLAAELIYTGDAQSATQLAEGGLIRRVVPDASLQTEALAMAKRIARNSGAALRAAKRALRVASHWSQPAVDRISRIYLDELMATDDAVEGLTSFVEKRTPEWSHR